MYFEITLKNMVKFARNQYFAIALVIFTMFVKVRMDTHDKKLYVKNDLSDNDLQLALSDLSLRDLKLLQQFIDFIDKKELHYPKNSHNYQVKFAEPPTQHNSNRLLTNNQRSKRVDQMDNISYDYLKQWDYSCPRSEEQETNKSNDDIEVRKQHIRVKRN